MTDKRKHRLAAVATLSVVAALLGASSAAAAVVRVDTTADEFGAGAGCSLREAVQSSNTASSFGGCTLSTEPANIIGDGRDDATLVELDNDRTYALTIAGDEDANAAGDLDVTAPIVLTADGDIPAGAGQATIDASAAGDRIFDLNTPGLPATGPGGGDKELYLFGLNLTGGSASSGGAILVRRGQAVARESAIYGSSAGPGADGDGGGILVAPGPDVPTGASGEFVSASVVNTTVSANSASGAGGGVASRAGGFIVLRQATVAENTARSAGAGPLGGGGIGVHEGASIATWANSIVADNVDGGGTAPDCAGPGPDPSVVGIHGANVIGDTSGCSYTGQPRDALDVDPLLGPLTDNGGGVLTHALAEGSPAIDTGDEAPLAAGGCVFGFDARLVLRLTSEDPRCDSGAYERQFCAAAVVTIVSSDGGSAVGTDGPDGMVATGPPASLDGGGGADGVCGAKRPDELVGAGGSDDLLGEGGDDALDGGPGADSLDGGSGKDELEGGAGKDELVGDRGDDEVDGGGGKDELIGDAGDDKLVGGGGRDELLGDEGKDKLLGGGGKDKLVAGEDNDKLKGGGGRDKLIGGPGRNVLRCGGGKDVARADKNDRVKKDCERVRKIR